MSRGWKGDHQRHSEAAKKGWKKRRRMERILQVYREEMDKENMRIKHHRVLLRERLEQMRNDQVADLLGTVEIQARRAGVEPEELAGYDEIRDELRRRIKEMRNSRE